jgi:hypothetical protein
MELIIFAAFFGLLALFSALGWVADSRDGADWRPTVNGVRDPTVGRTNGGFSTRG